MNNSRKNSLKIKTWSRGRRFFLGLQTHAISLFLFPCLLSMPPAHRDYFLPPLPLSLFYCWTIILVQTVKCTILYFIEDKQTCRTSLCLDHDCTCKNELICKLCFTALYGWTSTASSMLACLSAGHRTKADAFHWLLTLFLGLYFFLSFPHLFLCWFICFGI